MKKLYFTLFAVFQILKIATLGVSALYLLFWFYRFFNFPFAETLSYIFNFFIMPITNNFPTTQIHGGHIAEYGYFIMGILLCGVVFIFAKLEDLMIALDRRYDIKDIVTNNSGMLRIWLGDKAFRKPYFNPDRIVEYVVLDGLRGYTAFYMKYGAAVQKYMASINRICDEYYNNKENQAWIDKLFMAKRNKYNLYSVN